MAGLVFFLLSAVVTVGAAVLERLLGIPWLVPLIFATATWAAWDSVRIRITDYRSGVSLSSVVLWFGIALFWIVGFPWYLTVRYRIARGTQPRTSGASPARAQTSATRCLAPRPGHYEASITRRLTPSPGAPSPGVLPARAQR